jgi:LCP family protein required for cell wall assembly
MGRLDTGSEKKAGRGAYAFGMLCMGVLALASVMLFAKLFMTRIMAPSYLYIAAGALVVLNGLHMLVQLPEKRGTAVRMICSVIALLLSAAMIFGTIAVGHVQSTIKKVADKKEEGTYIDVLVRVDDPAKELKDVTGYPFGMMDQMDEVHMQQAVQDLEQVTGTVEKTTYASAPELATALYEGKVDAILLNEAYIDVLSEMEGYEDFSEKTRVIHEFFYAEEMDLEKAKETNVDSDAFVVYLSGSDARSTNINVRARSDSNILAVVNPTTHQILLLNTPRDYYVPLARNGALDKLTHAGIYGISESINTLQNLYGVDVDYYARINFYGLIDIVDAVGGIDVESEQAFVLYAYAPGHTSSGEQHIVQGTNHLDGAMALAFSRERHQFADGDNQRGRNQMAVIKALAKKLTTPSALANYQSILGAVSQNLTTNFTYDEISSLVQAQLKDMPEWNIQTYAVTQGPGSTTQPCYSLGGGRAWVMPVNTDSVNQAKSLIETVMTGGTLD